MKVSVSLTSSFVEFIVKLATDFGIENAYYVEQCAVTVFVGTGFELIIRGGALVRLISCKYEVGNICVDDDKETGSGKTCIGKLSEFVGILTANC